VTPRLRSVRDRATTAGSSSALLLTGGLVLVFVVRIWAGSRVEAPILLCDEFIYAELAESFADEGKLLLRGEPSYQSLLYPVLLAPAWLASSVETTYELAKAINAALLTAAAVPVYVWSRRLMSRGWALLAPALTLLMPAQLYSGLLLTESAFLPAFLLATYAVARAIELPTGRRQLLALAAIALACGVRIQGLVLLVILPTAVLAAEVLDARIAPPGRRFSRERLSRWWPTAALLVVAASVYVIAQLARGTSFSEGFGSYQDVVTRGYSLEEGWRFGRLHLAALAISVGLVPLSALIVLATRAVTDPLQVNVQQRALLVVVTASAFWLSVEVGLFLSEFGGSIAERYIFHVAPLLFLVLAVWLAEGLPRPRLATAVGAAFPVALVLIEPLSHFLATDLLPSSFTLFAFFRLSDALSGVDEVVWAWRFGGLLAAVAFAVLWRPLAKVVIPVGISVFLLLAQRPGDEHLVRQSERVRFAPGVGANPSWVDDRIGPDTPVDFLHTPTPDGALTSSTIVLQLKFWNRSLESVINVGTPEACPLPERTATIDPMSGVIAVPGRPVTHVVAENGLDLAGAELAREGPLALYRVSSPVSLGSTRDGIYADGWTSGEAAITQYRTSRGRAGRARLGISRSGWTGPDVPGVVTIRIGPVEGSGIARPTTSRSFVIHSSQSRIVTLPTPKPPFRIEVSVNPTFSPADFGLSDSRRLGVQFDYKFLP
jgi:hypothetical protein